MYIAERVSYFFNVVSAYLSLKYDLKKLLLYKFYFKTPAFYDYYVISFPQTLSYFWLSQTSKI